MHLTPINSETIAASGTFTSEGQSLSHAVSGFSVYYSITGDGTVDLFYYASVDGVNFVKDTRSIKRGLTKISGPGGDGKGMLYVPVMPCNAVKLEAVETGGADSVVITVKLASRIGRFGDVPVYDGVSNGIRTVDYAHHEVHDGSAFWAANNATLGNGEINTVSITTPNTTKWAHLLLDITSSATASFDVLEDVTSLASGVAFTAMNFNRNSSKASGMTCKVGDTPGADPIVPTGGTAIWTETLGTRGIVTSRQNASELMLKQNSTYLFRITNGAASNNCTILLTWYEHTDR